MVVRTVLARLSMEEVVQVLVSEPELSVREWEYFFLPRVLSPLRCLIQVNMFLLGAGLLLLCLVWQYLPQVDVISSKLYRPLAEAMKSGVSQDAEQYCGGLRTAE